jgi:hypothetical protein
MAGRFGLLVLTGLALVALLAACGPTGDEIPSTEEFVNVWLEPDWGAEPGAKARFCTAYGRNPERYRERFTADYEPEEGFPTAREILDEAAGRC